MIEDKPLLSEYLSESQELLDLLLADLDSLGTGSSETNTNLVNRIFRTVHSLKGITGMMGLAQVQSIAHEFEDILDSIRLGRLKLADDTVAMLQEAGAGLAALLIVSARGSATEDDAVRLRDLLASIGSRSTQNPEAEVPDLSSLGLSEREQKLLSEFEKHRIAENLRAGRSLYLIIVTFRVRAIDRGYRSLISRLDDHGEFIATLPGAPASADEVSFKLLLATHSKEPDIRFIADDYKGKVTRLGGSTGRRLMSLLTPAGRKQRKTIEEEAKDESNLLLPASFARESLQPLSASVRVELSQIDELSSLAHQIATETQGLSSLAEKFLGAAGLGARERFDLRITARRLEREFLEFEERLVELRMVSLAQTFTRAARLGSRLAGELGKLVSVEIRGRETQLDKMIVDKISDPIYHILRNALDHGLEQPDERRQAGKSPRGKITLQAFLEGRRVVIVISDDGRGIDPRRVELRAIEIGAISADQQLSEEERLRLVLRPGFSTAEQVSAVSGRGVGLDAVDNTVRELGGEIRVSSTPGHGARFELSVPSTLVMISAFIVRVGEWRYAIDVGHIIELLMVGPSNILGRDGKRNIRWRDNAIPLIELRYILGLGGARILHPADSSLAPGDPPLAEPSGGEPAEPSVPVLVIRTMDRHVAIAVEGFEEQREIIVKSLGSMASEVKGVVGAVDLEGGDVALVLDLPSLLLFRSMRV